MRWIEINQQIPRSAKIMPCWIKVDVDKKDLVYMTDDEKFFVSIDHRRVYPVEQVEKWSLIETL